MKKLLLTTIVVLSMSWASFAGNGLVAPSSRNGNDTESIEKAKPHTQQYQDFKKILDEYEQDVKNAKTCEDLENAAMSLVFKLFATTENEYEEEVTPEEDQELSDYMDRIDKKVTELQEHWGCKTEEDEDNGEEAIELVETSTEEWEAIINEFDAIVTQMEKMMNLDFEKDENIDKLLEVVMPLQQISERMDHSSSDNLTQKQSSRLEQINERLVTVATTMGLMD